jgi:hypothetical protein
VLISKGFFERMQPSQTNVVVERRPGSENLLEQSLIGHHLQGFDS